MARYLYKGIKADGEHLVGEMDAPDRQAVIATLQDAGLLPVWADPVDTLRRPRPLWRRWSRARTLSQRDLAAFTHELATILQAGLPLDQALEMVGATAEKAATRSLVAELRAHVQGGGSFSDALEHQGAPFDRLYVSTVRAGEAAGALEVVLARLADHAERAVALRETVKSALIYPAILVCVAGLSLMLLLMYVVPQFEPLFQDMGQSIPMATQIVFGFAEGVRQYWWLPPAALLAAYWLVRVRMADPKVRLRWDRFVLKLPVISDIVLRFEVARFSRTLATLLENGVPLLAAMGIVRDSISNRALADSMEAVIDGLKQGRGLTRPLEESGHFPPLAVRLIHVGEETGRLESMMVQIADTYEAQLREAVRRALTLLEPALILILGAVIAAIILSILVAILSLNNFVI